MTSHPNVIKKRSHYLMGPCLIDEFYKDGVDGYISFVGHTPTENVIWTDQGLYLDDDLKSIWKHEKENVFLLECGSGFGSGRLACLCLETRQRFYSEEQS